MNNKILVLSTCGSTQEAERLGRALIEQQLAACVTVLPGARSFYRWQGAIESAEECVLLIKSSAGLFPALTAAIQRLHSYEVPEILAVPIADGSPKYLEWFEGNLRSAAEPGDPR